MKIKDITLTNYPLFGTLTLDFTLEDGQVADTIVIAGENGCGKTMLLELIYEFSLLEDFQTVRDEQRVFTLQLTAPEYDQVREQLSQNAPDIQPSDSWQVTLDLSRSPSDAARLQFSTQATDRTWQPIASQLILANPTLRGLLKSVYSTVEINYEPQCTPTITNGSIEAHTTTSVKSGPDLATSIQQLLIDIQSRDANDLNDWAQAHAGQVPPESLRNRRIKQFQAAFEVMFSGSLNYEGVKNLDAQRQVFFRKGERLVELADLSSGEKQIVFRGAFLLQNRASMCGHLVLIDEPELSLHPAWRSHILHYYQSLFADDGGQLGAQLFVTTHSPRVIEAGFAQKSTLILVLRRQGEQISAHHIQHTPALPTLSIAETNYLAFHLISVDYHVGLYSFMQAKFALTSITQADKFIATHAAFDPQSIAVVIDLVTAIFTPCPPTFATASIIQSQDENIVNHNWKHQFNCCAPFAAPVSNN